MEKFKILENFQNPALQRYNYTYIIIIIYFSLSLTALMHFKVNSIWIHSAYPLNTVDYLSYVTVKALHERYTVTVQSYVTPCNALQGFGFRYTVT